MLLLEIIKEKSKEIFDEIVSIRRHLHMYPELSFKEYETSKYIKSLLKNWNISYAENIAENGIVVVISGDIECKNDNYLNTIALRADFDALPIQEETNLNFKSKNIGVMHACGHDLHTASLLGVIKILNSLKQKFSGTIKFIFQPAEEMLPGGAAQMISEGVLKNPNVNIALAQHVYTELDVGKVGFRKGQYMASTDEIYINVEGQNGHAAIVEGSKNPISVASHLVFELNSYFKKKKFNKHIFSIGNFISNGSTNIIPKIAKLKGTFRAMSEDFRKKSHENIRKIVSVIEKESSCKVFLEIRKGYPSLFNDVEITQKTIDFASKYLGEENVVELDERMTAEDFAYFSKKVPSCFYRLGVSNKHDKNRYGLHNSKFNPDEKSLLIGCGLMSWIAINHLNCQH